MILEVQDRQTGKVRDVEITVGKVEQDILIAVHGDTGVGWVMTKGYPVEIEGFKSCLAQGQARERALGMERGSA